MFNDEFCATFFNAFNFLMVQLISVYRLMTGQLETNETFYLFSGIEVDVENPGGLVQQIIIEQIGIHKKYIRMKFFCLIGYSFHYLALF